MVWVGLEGNTLPSGIIWVEVVCYNEAMKEDGKTIEVRPNWWERNSQRLRNAGVLALFAGGLFGMGWLVAAGGIGTVGGHVVYSSERDMRQTSTKHKGEEKK